MHETREEEREPGQRKTGQTNQKTNTKNLKHKTQNKEHKKDTISRNAQAPFKQYGLDHAREPIVIIAYQKQCNTKTQTHAYFIRYTSTAIIDLQNSITKKNRTTRREPQRYKNKKLPSDEDSGPLRWTDEPRSRPRAQKTDQSKPNQTKIEPKQTENHEANITSHAHKTSTSPQE